jgi:ankyrin repeat protein
MLQHLLNVVSQGSTGAAVRRVGAVMGRLRASAAPRMLLLGLALLAAPVMAGPVDDFLHAARNDDSGAVAQWLARGVDPNSVDDKGRPALYLALLAQNEKTARVLVRAKGVDLNFKTPQDETPLMMAAFRGYKALVEEMIAAGAQVNKPGWTPLHYAATNGHKDVVALLLEEHAYIDAESPSKTTPLMMAARHGHAEVVRLLLEEGADATVKNVHELTAFDFAMMSERKDIADLIAEHLRKTQLKKGW